MNEKVSYFWFQLFMTHGIGPKSLISIAEELELHRQQPENLPLNQAELTQFPETAKITARKIHLEDSDKIFVEYEKLQKRGITLIYPGHPDSPRPPLRNSPILFLKGQRRLLTSDGVAIVGARNVSSRGIQIAKVIATDLANKGINVVSGYSKGVDSTAHLAALEAEGTTTLVLPYGINELRQKREFKKFNWNQDILAVSQFPPDAKWLARNAMVRNKLICAMSNAVVVIESGLERDAKGKMSGTFDTGKTALKTNLPLFVVDPEYFEEPPEGNKDLIARGGQKLDPSGGARDIVSHLEKTKSMNSFSTPLNTHEEAPLQTDFIDDLEVSTENNTSAW